MTVEDGTRPPWPAGSFDRVLVDAPCSGLGALRRRPEAAGVADPRTSRDLVPLQQAPAGPRARPGPARWGRPLRDLLAGARRDPRRACGAVLVGRDDGRSTTPGPADRRSGACRRPDSPDRCPAPSSSGRTATAPTRCSWRCFIGRDGGRLRAARVSRLLGEPAEPLGEAVSRPRSVSRAAVAGDVGSRLRSLRSRARPPRGRWSTRVARSPRWASASPRHGWRRLGADVLHRPGTP